MVQAVPVSFVPFSIRFMPDGRTFTAERPTPLVVAAAAVGILLEQPCGGEGTCGDCRVRVMEGEAAESSADRDVLSVEERAQGWRLACHLTCTADLAVEVPLVSRAVSGKTFGPALPPEALDSPCVMVITTRVEPDSRSHSSCLDSLSVSAGLGPGALTASVAALAELSAAAQENGKLTAVVHRGDLVAVRHGASLRRYGLAVDIGTTSLAVALINLANGDVAGERATLNPQAAFGADVIARIKFAADVADGRGRLAEAVRGGIRALVTDLLETNDAAPDDVVICAVAGNPTMMHAWAEVNLAGLGHAPYVGAWSGPLLARARELGLPIHPNAPVFGFPPVRSHVGGDLVAAAIAARFDERNGRRLLIDLGTNSEILVADGRRFVATSGAAGPAFEGVSIHHGMRAAPGAVDLAVVEDDGRLTFHVVGDVPPTGLCGSGLIDLVAELCRVGVIDASGYLRGPDELPPGPAQRLGSRVIDIDRQRAFRVGDATGPILTARDIREVQLAKGSIRAAVRLTCRALGFEPEDLHEVLLAGAFGNCIRKASAVRLGLVPALDPTRIHFIGNAAGIGARLALVDQRVHARAERLAAEASYLDLAAHPGYQDTFIGSLAFDLATGPRHGTR
jgi:uncharacterized 2Fe-2S/4Fe-4S cluster protein (DUF4445 family)